MAFGRDEVVIVTGKCVVADKDAADIGETKLLFGEFARKRALIWYGVFCERSPKVSPVCQLLHVVPPFELMLYSALDIVFTRIDVSVKVRKVGALGAFLRAGIVRDCGLLSDVVAPSPTLTIVNVFDVLPIKAASGYVVPVIWNGAELLNL